MMVADGERELVQEMMEVLLAEYPAQLATLRTALHHGDARRLERTAHSLKGALGAVGATRAQGLAQQLEAKGRTDQLEGARSIWQQLDIELVRLVVFWTHTSETK